MSSNIIITNSNVAELKNINLKKSTSFSIDIETTGLNFSNDSVKYINIFDNYTNKFYIYKINNNTDRSNIKKIIENLLSNEYITLYFHNAQFDLLFLKKDLMIDFSIKKCQIRCSKILSYLTNHQTYSLKYLLEKYFDSSKIILEGNPINFKTYWDNPLNDNQIEYMKRDVEYLEALHKTIVERFSYDKALYFKIIQHLPCEDTNSIDLSLFKYYNYSFKDYMFKLKEGLTIDNMPVFSTNSSAGMDIKSIETYTLEPKQVKLISTGVFLNFDSKQKNRYYLELHARSGLSVKHKITLINNVGIIDGDYEGEIMVALINHSNENFTINEGDRVAQLILKEYIKEETTPFIYHIKGKVRSVGGFGSTGL